MSGLTVWSISLLFVGLLFVGLLFVGLHFALVWMAWPKWGIVLAYIGVVLAVIGIIVAWCSTW